MKREGRQHGMVRTYPSPKPQSPPSRPLNSTRTAAAHFAKVSTKPTNHSKFTGKCGRPMCRECHVSPASKSKDKAKGSHRIRSSSRTRLSGFSATSILNYLDSDERCYEEHDPQFEIEQVVECEGKKNGINQHLSFSNVGFVWEVLEDGDEDWYLV